MAVPVAPIFAMLRFILPRFPLPVTFLSIAIPQGEPPQIQSGYSGWFKNGQSRLGLPIL